MTYRLDAPLPGFEPGYIRLDATRQPDGSWAVRVWGVDGPGFVSARDSDLYEHLASWEVLDVANATLMTMLGVPDL